MPSIINATTTGGVVVSGDNSGSLQLQNSGVTELTVASTGVTVADNLLFNSGYGSAAVAYGCRAWVNFDGRSSITIRGSGNISSITDNGTGDYTLNFTNAMPDANYAASISVKPTVDAKERPELDNLLAASIRVVNDGGANDYQDPSTFTVAVFR